MKKLTKAKGKTLKRQPLVTPQNRGKTGVKRKPPVGRRFQKGQSGNPGGRPRKNKLVDAMRDWLELVDEKTGFTNAELVAAAIGRKALKGNPEAFKAIGDRTEGKPAQTVTVTREIGLGPIVSQFKRGEMRHYCETGEVPERFRAKESKADG